MTKFVLFAASLFLFMHPAIAGVTAWIPLTVENGHISIPVTVAGIEGKAILDTGSQLNALNRNFRKKHSLEFSKGKKYRIAGVYGEEEVDSFNKVPVNLFGSEVNMNGVADISLGFHSTSLLLGAGFLEQFIIQLDYPNARIRFITHDTLDLEALQNIEFQSQMGTSMPIVKVGLGESSAWVLFDTGNSGGLLMNKSKIETLQLHDSPKGAQSLSIGATNHVAVLDNYRVPELQFGPYTLENVLVSVPTDNQKVMLGERYKTLGSHIRGKKVDGILGYDVLQHFLITIDYKNGHAHIGLPE